jgi:ribonuclease HI
MRAMPFKEMKFKNKRVFVQVDEAGQIVVEKGRATMKYKLDDDQTYGPNPKNLVDMNSAVMPMSLSASKKNTKPTKTVGIIPEGAVVAYTDGGCIGNPGPSGLGYFISFPDGRQVERGEPLGHGTNNIAELTAIQRVLELCDDRSQTVVIHTDSTYAIGVLTLGWKAKANQSLIAKMKKLLAQFSDVELRKVKGHAGILENERVDDLARGSAETQTFLGDPPQ